MAVCRYARQYFVRGRFQNPNLSHSRFFWREKKNVVARHFTVTVIFQKSVRNEMRFYFRKSLSRIRLKNITRKSLQSQGREGGTYNNKNWYLKIWNSLWNIFYTSHGQLLYINELTYFIFIFFFFYIHFIYFFYFIVFIIICSHYSLSNYREWYGECTLGYVIFFLSFLARNSVLTDKRIHVVFFVI